VVAWGSHFPASVSNIWSYIKVIEEDILDTYAGKHLSYGATDVL